VQQIRECKKHLDHFTEQLEGLVAGERSRMTGTTTVTKKEARALRVRTDTLENRERKNDF
jgi:hypothetical protein